MFIRREVMRQATELANVAGFDPDTVYCWLMDLANDRGYHPRKIPITAAPGLLFVTGCRDTDYLEKFDPAADRERSRVYNAGPVADYYWDRIMERQERYMDD